MTLSKTTHLQLQGCIYEVFTSSYPPPRADSITNGIKRSVFSFGMVNINVGLCKNQHLSEEQYFTKIINNTINSH